MGIDIYLGGYDAYNRRTRNERKAFQEACAARDKLTGGLGRFDGRDPKQVAAQQAVEEAADKMWAATKGYLRSSYNNGGLFNVLDRIFGIDSAQLLFPGDWDEQGEDANGERTGLAIKWEPFLAAVATLKAAARCLKHGDPLPLRLDELDRGENGARKRAEAFGAAVATMVTEVWPADQVESGNDHQHGFYNEDDYGWYVHEGLDELEQFGKLGECIAKRGGNDRVIISF